MVTKACDCKCIMCGATAVAFWPAIDPDIPSHPYCRDCLDKEKSKLLGEIMGVPHEVVYKMMKNKS